MIYKCVMIILHVNYNYVVLCGSHFTHTYVLVSQMVENPELTGIEYLWRVS